MVIPPAQVPFATASRIAWDGAREKRGEEKIM